MMERLYTSPTYGMWYPGMFRHLAAYVLYPLSLCLPVDDKSLSSNMPPMVVFPEASLFYTKWQHSLEDRGVTIRLSTEVTKVLHRGADGVTVLVRPRRPKADKHNPAGADTDLPETVEQYDEIVLCVLADTAKHLLGKTATWAERSVLGSTTWSDDITVTHCVSSSAMPVETFAHVAPRTPTIFASGTFRSTSLTLPSRTCTAATSLLESRRRKRSSCRCITSRT
jgi:hypothetical protein